MSHAAFVILDTKTGALGSTYDTKMPAFYATAGRARGIITRSPKHLHDRLVVCRARIVLDGTVED